MISDRKINSFTKPVVSLADQPVINAADLKAWFDSNSNEIIAALNGIIDDLSSTSGAANVGADSITSDLGNIPAGKLIDTINAVYEKLYDYEAKLGSPDGTDNILSNISSDGITYKNVSQALNDLNSYIDGKVDKITGKGLSTNDYTNDEKTKLAGLTQYTDSMTFAVAGEVTHEHNIDSLSHTDIRNNIEELQFKKVDNIEGKGLSTNDYTDDEKLKLGNLYQYTDENATSIAGSVAIDIVSSHNTDNSSHQDIRQEISNKINIVNGKLLTSMPSTAPQFLCDSTYAPGSYFRYMFIPDGSYTINGVTYDYHFPTYNDGTYTYNFDITDANFKKGMNYIVGLIDTTIDTPVYSVVAMTPPDLAAYVGSDAPNLSSYLSSTKIIGKNPLYGKYVVWYASVGSGPPDNYWFSGGSFYCSASLVRIYTDISKAISQIQTNMQNITIQNLISLSSIKVYSGGADITSVCTINYAKYLTQGIFKILQLQFSINSVSAQTGAVTISGISQYPPTTIVGTIGGTLSLSANTILENPTLSTGGSINLRCRNISTNVTGNATPQQLGTGEVEISFIYINN